MKDTKKNVYRGNETEFIKAPNAPKSQPAAKTVVGKDLRSIKKGGKK